MFWLGLGREGGGLDILWPTLGPQDVSLEQDLSLGVLCSEQSELTWQSEWAGLSYLTLLCRVCY